MSTYKYFPELESEFNNYWLNKGIIMVEQLKVPAIISHATFLNLDTVFGLLFNDEYLYTSYKYLFRHVDNVSLEKPVKERIYCTGAIVDTYVSDDGTGQNILDLTTEDLQMLDCLLYYRMGNVPDLTPFDFDSLSTLSKLIYIYLQIKVNSDFTFINSSNTISNMTNVLENFYEIYVVNETYSILKTWGILA